MDRFFLDLQRFSTVQERLPILILSRGYATFQSMNKNR